MASSLSKDRLAALVKQVSASLSFAISSILIVMVIVFCHYDISFPSFQVLGLGQIMAIILVVGGAKTFGMVQFPNPSFSQVTKVWPLPLFYILNLVFGLGSTKKLNLPMFTVLRRFTLLFISVGQVYVLNRYESIRVNVTLLFMVSGAFIAALNDLAFDVTGYVFVLINDFTTAASVVYSKQKLNTEMSKWELLFYNALISLPPALFISFLTGDITKAYNYPNWKDPAFFFFFLLACVMGFFLMYSTVLVNQLTSPLTLSVLGCIKNVLVTYCGMFVGGDYIFDPKNFIGINISVAASIAYSIFKFKEQTSDQQQAPPSEPSSAVKKNNITTA